MHEHTVRVTTAAGTVEGFTRDGVHRWRSIPYARPPVGALRFRAPQPAQPWRGVRYCHGFTKCAPQERRYTIVGVGKYQPMGEDCLTLNVVTPEAPESESLPVMVFVHGGGYIMGSSATPIYDGVGLARRGCVYVSVNYRLGALGCLDLSSLSTADVTLESNLFLRDLVLALRWVQQNIAAFGGDPDNVTVFGESAGAHAVATLLAVPEAEGLFAHAISESPATGMVRSREIAAEFAGRFATLLGVRKQDAAHALMQASPADLVAAQNRLIDQGVRDMLGAFPIGPVSGDDVLPLDPVEAMRRGKAHRVPLIVGTNAEEGRLFTRFLPLLPTTEPMVEALLAEVEPAARERITGRLPGLSGAVCVRAARRRLRLQLGCLGDRRSPRQARARLPVSIRLRTAGTALVRAGRHARHRIAGGLRHLPHQVRGDADRGRRSAIRVAGHQRSAKALAVIQPYRGARRRLAGLHRHRPRGDGLRPQVASRIRSAPERRMAWEGFSLAR